MAGRVAAVLLPFAQKFIRRRLFAPIQRNIVGKLTRFVHSPHLPDFLPGATRVGQPLAMSGFRKPRQSVHRPLMHVQHAGSFPRTFAQFKARGRTGMRRFHQFGGRTLAARRVRRSRMNLPVELKFLDTFLAATNLSVVSTMAGGEFNPTVLRMITTPSVGDDESQRDGKHIIVKSVHVMGTISLPSVANLTAGIPPATGFVALIQDTMTAGAEVNSEDLFVNPGAQVVDMNQAHRNLLFGKRFKVLKLLKYSINAPPVHDGTNVETMGAKRRFEWWIPSINMHVNFNAGTTDSVANVVDNSLQILGFCSTNANQPTTQLSYTARVRFVG